MFIKRLIDITLSSCLLLLLLPLILALAVVIFWQRDGGVLFPQTRLGVARKPFQVYKFRSMTAGEINWAGRFMRPLGLDELPQLWNIVIGDMSLVGPRPLTSDDVERLGWSGADYDQRWSLRPGLVGLAQFSPVCNRELSWQLDVSYIGQRSLCLDMQVVFWASLVPVLGKQRIAAYLNLPLRFALTRSE